MTVATKVIIKALNELNLDYSFSSKDKIVITIHYPSYNHTIINFNLGIVNSSQFHFCLDKAYQDELLDNCVNQPKTTSYIDPQGPYPAMTKYKQQDEIVNNIDSRFNLPLIIKKNKGSEGIGVYLCKTKEDVQKSVELIFNHNHKDYDHVLLAQQYIKPKAEYRAVFYKRKLEILYSKETAEGTFTGNLSPLHFDGAKAIDINNEITLNKIARFSQPIFDKTNLEYCGLDIIEDENGKLWLIEINSSPAFAYYLDHNSEKKLINLFKKIFTDLNK